MEPQQQEAEAPPQSMDPDFSSVMGWQLLLEITRHVDAASRSNWRLVSKAALRAVYDSTTALAPCNDETGSTDNVLEDTTPTALLPQLVEKCSGLKQLSCEGLPDLGSTIDLLQLPQRLEALDISDTDVTDLSFITHCTSLRRLGAADVPGCAGPESRQLAAVLQQLPELTALKLNYNRLCVDAARDVAAVLQNLTDFKELDIGRIGQEAAAALLPALPHLRELRLLDVENCRLGGQALLPAILQLTRLQRLNLSYNGLQANDALILAPALRELTQLEELDLDENKLGDEGVSALAPAIQQLTGLRALALGTNGFGLAGAQALAPALRHLTRLQYLQLGSNGFGPTGAALLAPAIQELTGLQRLRLGSVALGAEGAAALGPALQRLTMLQDLDVCGNALGPDGLQALLPGIQQLTNLHSLLVLDNALDREGMLLFAAGIHQLTRLEQLYVSDPELDAEFGRTLARVIQTSSPGCEVSCRYEPLS